MAKQISGIDAAKMEIDGLGVFSIVGGTVTFNGNDGRSVSWTMQSNKMANAQLRFFRGAAAKAA